MKSINIRFTRQYIKIKIKHNEITNSIGETVNGICVILAAGDGKRMKNNKPKVIHNVAGVPMIRHVVKVAEKIAKYNVVVASEKNKTEIKSLIGKTEVKVQKRQLGTADAVIAAQESIKKAKKNGAKFVVVLNGDTPLITARPIVKATKMLKDAEVAVGGFYPDNPKGYGRLVVRNNALVEIKEHKDATKEEKKIMLCNSGIFVFKIDTLIPLLKKINNKNVQKEFYLGDVVKITKQSGQKKCVVFDVPKEDVTGVNSQAQLAEVEGMWQTKKRTEMMNNGVIMPAPDTVFFGYDTKIQSGVTVEQNVVFGEGVTVGRDSVIKAFSHIEGAYISKGAVVGPYARIRPKTNIGKNAKIGNFVEIKNSKIGEGAKVNHLAYVGDAEVGKNVNVGAGTITCNYDGKNKHKTIIKQNTFVGSNTSLVAPVTIGANCVIGAGSVITKDVPKDTVAVERSKQTHRKRKNNVRNRSRRS